MATHSNVLAWRIPGRRSLVGCRLWGRTESDTTEATQQQQQQPSFRGSSPPRDETHISYVSCIGRQVLYHQHHLGSPFLFITESLILLKVSNRIVKHAPNSVFKKASRILLFAQTLLPRVLFSLLHSPLTCSLGLVFPSGSCRLLLSMML